MGTYCTTTSLETMWGQASFDNLTSTADLMIEQAENEINKILASRYDMSAAIFQTSTSIPPMIKTICEWLATGYLFENTARGSEDSYRRADRYIKKAHDNMMGLINHDYALVDTAGAEVLDAGNDFNVLGNQEDYHETFNEDHPLNWSVDDDKLDDIYDERD